MTRILPLLAAVALVVSAGTADAKACRDAKGKYVKCPAAAMASAKPQKCRDAKGKFVKCSVPGAMAVK